MGKVNEAIEILKALGLPKAQQNERSGLTLLALLDLKGNSGWSTSKQRIIRIHDVLEFVQANYGKGTPKTQGKQYGVKHFISSNKQA